MTEMHKKEYLAVAELAEAGQYEQALAKVQAYLKAHPNDGEALNDAGTILYCMHRGREAIEYFEKARSCSDGDNLCQVVFNLCETYLAENLPEKAVGLLGEMESMGVLNIDTINRIGNAFVDQLAYGPAIEMLLYSLRLASNQEILEPMLQILRSKRLKVAIFADSEQRIQGLKGYLDPRFPLEISIGFGQDAAPVMQRNQVSIFMGCGSGLMQAGYSAFGHPILVFLTMEDLSDGRIEQVQWQNVHTVILPSDPVRELFQERLGTVPASLRILTIPPCVDVESISFNARKRGKRIAAIGPWNAHQNPMFLLQCMQKLHYLDPDMRLYMAGEFEDESIRQYTESMIEAMELDNVVFLDGIPKNWNRWLKDKHYIVSTAVDGRGLSGVLTGMAAGLRPVVHHFPQAGDFMEPEHLFLLAEDFCRQILEDEYQSTRYRQLVVQRFSTLQAYPPVERILSEIERRVLNLSRPQPASAANLIPVEPRRMENPPVLEPEFSLSAPSIPVQNPVSPPEPAPVLPAQRTIEEAAQKALRALKSFSEQKRNEESAADESLQFSGGRQTAAPF